MPQAKAPRWCPASRPLPGTGIPSIGPFASWAWVYSALEGWPAKLAGNPLLYGPMLCWAANTL